MSVHHRFEFSLCRIRIFKRVVGNEPVSNDKFMAEQNKKYFWQIYVLEKLSETESEWWAKRIKPWTFPGKTNPFQSTLPWPNWQIIMEQQNDLEKEQFTKRSLAIREEHQFISGVPIIYSIGWLYIIVHFFTGERFESVQLRVKNSSIYLLLSKFMN